MSYTNYMRQIQEVKCDRCGITAFDVNVEKVHFKEVEKGSFETYTTMDCLCGGSYQYKL